MKLSKVQQEAVDFYTGCCNVIASAGSGKALMNGTGVLTPHGYVPIEDLKVGDVVFGQDGKQCNVVGVYPQGLKDVYEIMFSDKNIIRCSEDHLWFYQTSQMRDCGKVDVKPLKELLDIPLKIKSGSCRKNNLYIPMCKPVEFGLDDYTLEIPPYAMGALLGDGYLRDFGQISIFSSESSDIVQRVSDELFQIGFSLQKKKSDDYDYEIIGVFDKSGKSGRFNEVITELGLANSHSDTKFIPKKYLFASVNERIALMQGLIDTDGSCTGSAYEYYTVSKKLAEDVMFLAESLGLSVSISQKKTTYKYDGIVRNGKLCYRLNIKQSKEIPKLHFSESRDKYYHIPQAYARKFIIDITKLNHQEHMTCIKVDNEDGSFLTEHCIVTHNTRVLVNRIVKLIEDYDVEPGKILAITFSKKAKENMVERLTKMIPEYVNFINIETFHSFGYRIVRQFNRENFEILDADWKKVKIIEEIYQSVYRTREVDGEEVANILHYIAVQKNQMKKPDVKEKYGKVYKKYEEYKHLHNQLDFDDMLTRCYEILVSNPKGLAYCQEKYQFILADEMQDTNAVQYEILKLIGAKYKNVFVVDDPLQNIFQWRGSDNRFVLEFDQEWPDAKTIQLNKNYRSSLNIVRAANHFAEKIPESGHVHYVESVADKGEFKEPLYQRYFDENTEATEIANQIKQLVEAGYHYNDIAVLTRTNAQLQYFETALYREEVPYTVVDGMSFIDRKEIKIVLSYLRLVCDINDDEAFEYIYNRPNRFLGSQFLQEVKRAARKEKISLFCAMSRVIKTNWRYKSANAIYGTVNQLSENHYRTVADMIKDMREMLDLDSYVSKDLSENDDSKTENLNTLQSMASNYKDVKRFVAFMLKFAKEKKTDKNSVQLMTIHKSKGLEFPVVFVAGVNQGILPHGKNENLDEEKRLMYVAITRAEKELFVSSTQLYNGRDMDESEFIAFLFG